MIPNSKDKQAIFDYVVEKLRLQNCKSIEGSSCLYRGPNNTKCAGGHLIPDEDYSVEMEGWSVSSSCLNKISQYFISKEFDCDFIKALQDVHDNYPIHLWEFEFYIVAKKYDLIYALPNPRKENTPSSVC